MCIFVQIHAFFLDFQLFSHFIISFVCVQNNNNIYIDHICMNEIRGNAIQKAIHSIHHVPNCTIGIIMGTLGRQGNPAIVQRIKDLINQYNQDHKNKNTNNDNGGTNGSSSNGTIRHFTMLLSEISPYKLNLFQKKVQIWIQIACPRLSIDWGHYLTNNNTIPVLNPYEFYCCFNSDLLWYNNNDDNDEKKNNNSSSRQIQSYPMDYYSSQGGPWSNYHANNKSRTMTTRNENNQVVSSEKIMNQNNDVAKKIVVSSPPSCGDCSCKNNS